METKEKKQPKAQFVQPGKQYLMDSQPEVVRSTYKGSGKLIDKVALISGGDSGIGRSVAVYFAREGANLAITYLPEEEEDAQFTKELVEAEGAQCLLLPGDLRNKDFCEHIVEETYGYFGKLNILVNNAAEQHAEHEFENISDENMVNTFATNIFAFMRVSKAALRYLEKGDCIINTSSVTAFRGNIELVDYSSTKGAIVSFTRALSGNLAKKGIRVNGVAPGPIWTPLIPATFDAEHVKGFGKHVPLGRVGQPSEVAPCYVFLASDDSSYITGQFLHPNGGEIING